MVALNKNAFKPGEITPNKECYKDVLNYSSEVYGHNIKTERIVHEDLISINKENEPLSRCGQCLELNGPTLKTITYMITQIFKFNIRIVIVSEETLTLLTSNALGIDGIFNQITVREADCRFKIKPTLYVVGTNETTASLQIINSNKVIEKITVNDDYYITPNAHFYIPINSNLNKIIAYTLEDNSTSFFNVNLTTISSYTSDVVIPNDEYDSCNYIINTVAYSKTKQMETYPAFAYTYYTYNICLYLTEIETQNDQLLFIAEETRKVRMSFAEKNIVLLNRHPDLFYLTLKPENDFNVAKTVIGLNQPDVLQMNNDNVGIMNLNYEEYLYEEDNCIIKEYKFYIPPGFIEFCNAISVRVFLEVNKSLKLLKLIIMKNLLIHLKVVTITLHYVMVGNVHMKEIIKQIYYELKNVNQNVEDLELDINVLKKVNALLKQIIT